MSEDKQVIYKQDCESFRYEDRLYWSRFQTLTVIEGAAIGVIFTNYIKGGAAIAIAFGTFFLVALIMLLALKGRGDSKNFLKRMDEYEAANGVSSIRPSDRIKLLNLSIPFDSLIFTVSVSVLLEVFNIYLIIYAFRST